ncbi:MAG: thiol reductase thioredoxin [Candidatus Aminicenantes bacterium]|nr:thiol reductase thioredoxin [Candidatus Aminicenantes bacterium]
MTAGFAPAQIEIVGSLTPEVILEKIPEWKSFVDGYSPRLDVISRLQEVPEVVRVEIYLGAWCPDCRQHVSAYLKIMDMVRNPMIRTTYTGLPRDRAARGPYTEGKNIERIPTFIVFLRDQEIGRIIETPALSVEEDLWNILALKLQGPTPLI